MKIIDGQTLIKLTIGLKPFAQFISPLPIAFSGEPDGVYKLNDGRIAQRFLNFGSPSTGFILEAGEKLEFKPLPKNIL